MGRRALRGWVQGLPAAPAEQKLAQGHTFHLTKRKLVSRLKEGRGFFLEANSNRSLWLEVMAVGSH